MHGHYPHRLRLGRWRGRSRGGSRLGRDGWLSPARSKANFDRTLLAWCPRSDSNCHWTVFELVVVVVCRSLALLRVYESCSGEALFVFAALNSIRRFWCYCVPSAYPGPSIRLRREGVARVMMYNSRGRLSKAALIRSAYPRFSVADASVRDKKYGC